MFILLNFLFVCFLHSTTGISFLEEKRLRDDLFLNYSKEIRPVLDLNNQIGITALLTIYSLYELNLDKGHLVTRASLGLFWRDEHLNWEPKNYGNITSIYLDSKYVWMPNIIVCNSEDEANKNSGNTFELILHSNGLIEFMQTKILRTFCDIDVYAYPFDKQICEIWLCIIVQKNIHVTFKNLVQMSYKVFPNYQWDIEMDDTIEKSNDTEPYIHATVYLTRKLKISSVARILPAGVLSILTLCVFLLPPESGEKVSLATTIFLTNVVYLVEMDKTLTSNSKHPALIILFLICLTSLSGIGTIGAIIVCKVQVVNEENSKKEKPVKNAWMTCKKNKVTPINTIDLNQKPTFDLENDYENFKDINNKRIMGSGHRLIDNIFLLISCVTFIIFSVIFTYYFNIP